MTARRLGRFEVDSAEWLDARLSSIGGSDVAPILGLSPWVSAFSLWHQKAGLLPEEVPDSGSIYWGKAMEKVILARWREGHPEHGAANWQGSTWADRTNPWRHANPDWVATSPTRVHHEVVEVKTAAYADEWGPSGSDRVPMWYLCQLLWYLDVLGCRWGWLVVLIGGNDYREYRIDASDHTEDLVMIRAATAEFWATVQAGEVPPIDGSNSTYQTVRKLHPDIDGERIEIPRAIADQLVGADQRYKAAQTERQAAMSTVLDLMGTAQHADVDGLRIAYRTARATKAGEPGIPFLTIDRKAGSNLTERNTA